MHRRGCRSYHVGRRKQWGINVNSARASLQVAYQRNGKRPVAYIDETYNVDPRHGQRYYVMAAVVVQGDQAANVRAAIVGLAGASYWHTSEKLRSASGRQRTVELLEYLGDADGSEFAIVSHETVVAPDDVDGEVARRRCLRALLSRLGHAPAADDRVQLFILERRRENAQANRDAKTKAEALADGVVPATTRLLQVSPGDEQLLWLPDLVCSAYRQQVAHRDESLFGLVDHLTEVLHVEA